MSQDQGRIVLVAESEGAAKPYNDAVMGFANSAGKQVIINVAILPESIKEAKTTPIEDWDKTVAPIVINTLEEYNPNDVAVICSNDLSIPTARIVHQAKTQVVDIHEANAAMLPFSADKVAVLATKRVMKAKPVAEGLAKYGKEIVLPSDYSQDILDSVIYDNLVKKDFTQQAHENLMGVISEVASMNAGVSLCACRLITLYLDEVKATVQCNRQKAVVYGENKLMPWLDATDTVSSQAVDMLTA